MEQVDVIKQLVAKYPSDLKWAVSSSDIGQIFKNSLTISIIIEGLICL